MANTFTESPQSTQNLVVCSDLPDIQTDSIGIAGGKSAALIFLSLRSELYGYGDDRVRAQSLFTEIMETLADHSRTPDRIFMTGDPGAVRSVTLLTELGLIEPDPEISRILRNALERRNFINTIPSIPMPDPDIYGEALAFLSLFRDNEDSLERYSLQEHLISLTDNCLRLLTEAVHPLYDPADMKPSFMHSILRFALGIREKGIFPSKAQRIVSVIRDNTHRKEGCDKTDIHAAILRHMLGDQEALRRYIGRLSPSDRLSGLSQLALFSMAYAIPDLLADGLQGVSEAAIDAEHSLNLASGLMYLRLTNTNKRHNDTCTIHSTHLPSCFR